MQNTAGSLLKAAAASRLAWLLLALLLGGSYLAWQYLNSGQPPAPRRTYQWACAKCNYAFHQPIPREVANQSLISCPKCQELAAERVLHFRCNDCGESREVRGHRITPLSPTCPKCKTVNSTLQD